jgi:superfamily II DNA or RNA helicase
MKFYSTIELTNDQKRMLTVEKPGVRFNYFYQAHPYLAVEKFYTPTGMYQNSVNTTAVGNSESLEICKIPTGLLEILGKVKKPETPDDFKAKISTLISKFFNKFEPYDFQVKAIQDALYTKNLLIRAATGSGKSLIISLICKILTELKLKGLIVVPNISLVNQFDADITSYGLEIERQLVGGEHNKSLKNTEDNPMDFDKPLTISTYQSLIRRKELLKSFDFVIIDECHKTKAKEIYEIAKACVNTSYQIGLTGTIPQEKWDFLKVCSVFGMPRNYITPRELIDRGLGTNININVYKIQYEETTPSCYDYAKALDFLVKNNKRNELIVNLTKSLKGNTVILVSRNEHAHRLFHMLMPCKIEEKSYLDLPLQRAYNIFFMNGSTSGENREKIRNILENTETNTIVSNSGISNSQEENCNSILISNYQLMSTGVNIKNLHNLIFASPLKSYITISQSLGRLIRTHDSKTEVNVYDLADDFGVFKSQLRKRIKDCYEPQSYKISTKIHIL